jgi:hypothetical protein
MITHYRVLFSELTPCGLPANASHVKISLFEELVTCEACKASAVYQKAIKQ